MLRSSLSCDVMQGYFLSPPVTSAKFAELLRSRLASAPAEY